MAKFLNKTVSGLPMAEYQASEGLSKHKLDHFHTAPAYYKHRSAKEFKPSRAMELGTAVHDLVLEKKQTFFVASACDRRTTAGKAEWAAFCKDNIGKLVVNEEEGAAILGASEAASRLLEKVKIKDTELSMWWDRSGIQCRGRVDLVGELNGESVLLDLKTVTRISNFDRSFFDLRYDVQAEWYRHGYSKLTGTPTSFVFLAVDMEAPHLCQFVFPSSEVLQHAYQAIEDDLAQWKICTELDVWPGLPERRIIMPRY